MGSELPSANRSDWDRERRRREANRPLEEAGEGESEGFELAERELIDHASHGDLHGTTRILRHARTDGVEEEPPDDDRYGEPDHADRGDDQDR